MHLRPILIGNNTALKNLLSHLEVHLNSSIECAKEKFYDKIAIKLNDT